MFPLIPDDFPLVAVGNSVYRRTMGAPLFTAATDHIAADLALRLNRDGMARSSIYQQGQSAMVYGRG